MKIFILLLSFVLIFFSTTAQDIKSPCSCINKFTVQYPDIAEKDQLTGTVIVEYEIDSVCFASNPKIIKSLGPEFDKEALRITNLMISAENRCNSKCKLFICGKTKKRLPIKFNKPED